jgi:hypothetical protein
MTSLTMERAGTALAIILAIYGGWALLVWFVGRWPR